MVRQVTSRTTKVHVVLAIVHGTTCLSAVTVAVLIVVVFVRSRPGGSAHSPHNAFARQGRHKQVGITLEGIGETHGIDFEHPALQQKVNESTFGIGFEAMEVMSGRGSVHRLCD